MAFPLAGLLLSLAGKGLSTYLSVKNNREAREAQQAESARRQAHYEAKANEDPLSRSENQHLLGQYDRDAQQQIENARSMAAIKGATPEYAAAVQKGVAEGRANLMGQMSAGASARADKYEEMAEGARQEAAANEQAYHAQRNEQYANLAGNASSDFGSLVSASMSGGESGGQTEIDPNNSSIQEGNAAVQNMNKIASQTGVKTTAAPSAQSKLDTGMAAIKNNIAAADQKRRDDNLAIYQTEKRDKKWFKPIKWY